MENNYSNSQYCGYRSLMILNVEYRYINDDYVLFATFADWDSGEYCTATLSTSLRNKELVDFLKACGEYHDNIIVLDLLIGKMIYSKVKIENDKYIAYDFWHR